MHINPFYATYFFLYPLKTLENFPFFQDYRKRLSGTKQIEKCQSISDLAIFFITGLDIKIVDRNNFLEISTSLHQREDKDVSGTYMHCVYAAKSHMLIKSFGNIFLL